MIHQDKERILVHLDVSIIAQAFKFIRSGVDIIEKEIDRSVALEKSIGLREETIGDVNNDIPKQEELNETRN